MAFTSLVVFDLHSSSLVVIDACAFYMKIVFICEFAFIVEVAGAIVFGTCFHISSG